MADFADNLVGTMTFKSFVRRFGNNFSFNKNKNEKVFLVVDGVPFIANASKAVTADIIATGKLERTVVVTERLSSEEGRPNWFLVQYAGELKNSLLSGTV